MAATITTNCVRCNSQFSYTRKTSPRLYCSSTCASKVKNKRAYAREKGSVLCLECGSGIAENRKKFCSRKCQLRHQARRYGSAYNTALTTKSRGKTPERFLNGLLNKKIRRAELDITFLMDLWESQKGLCAISGQPMTHILGKGRVTTNMSLDQIVPGGGYTKDNVRLVCSICNIMKWTCSDEELRVWCKRILENNMVTTPKDLNDKTGMYTTERTAIPVVDPAVSPAQTKDFGNKSDGDLTNGFEKPQARDPMGKAV